MKTNIKIMVLTIGMVCSLIAPVMGQISAGDMTASAMEDGRLTLHSSLDSSFIASAKLWMFDGKKKVVVNPSSTRTIQNKESIRIDYTAQPSLSAQLELKAVGRCIVWQIICKNTGQDQLWLELGPEIRIRSNEKLTVFDGWDDYINPPQILPPKDQEYPNGKVVFPVAAAWNRKVSVGVGMEPGELVSFFRNSYQPEGDQGGGLMSAARIVVDAGKEQTIRFITCAAPGEWGKYEILEAYYDSFPQYFVPYPGIDPRVSLGDSMQNAWPILPGNEPKYTAQESSRRTYCGWSWCYAPFRRTGDILCRPELWEYKFYRAPARQYAHPREKFLQWRKDGLDFVKKSGLADLFYVDVVWCEDALAHERYPDALITGPDANVLNGATAGFDRELNVFPLNTSFGRQYEKDTRQIVDEFDPCGFALDCAGSTWRYTGPALPTLPARAWDDEVGVYCGVEVGVAKYMDFVHTLKRRDGSPAAVFPNVESGGPYGVFFRADATMLEGTPWQEERTRPDRIRWKLGHKTLVWHCTYRLNELLDESTITTPEQLKTIYRGLADFTLLQSLRLGAIPNTWMLNGQTKLMQWLPAMVECTLQGWQPVPAARAAEPVWTSRYGNGLKTLIAVAQETGEPFTRQVAIENPRIADGALLFSHYDGTALTNEIRNGETLTNLTVHVRTPILLRAQMEVLSPDTVTKADVKEDMGISRGTLQAVLHGEGSTKLRARVPADMNVEAVTWNGENVNFTAQPDWVEFTVENPHHGTLKVQYRSTLFDCTDKDLLDYPFVVDNKPSGTIVIPKNATELETMAAERLREYFRYWYGYVIEPNVNVEIPIVEVGSAVSGAVVNVRINPSISAAKITREGNILTIEAPDGKQLEAAMLKMLRALDRKYWTPGKLPEFVINKRLGLAGTVLD